MEGFISINISQLAFLKEYKLMSNLTRVQWRGQKYLAYNFMYSYDEHSGYK